MRIAFVISSLAAGGAQRVVVDLTSRLAALGHKVTLITYSKTDSDHFGNPLGVERVALDLLGVSPNAWRAFGSNVRRLRLLRETFATTRPDVVVSFIDLTNILVLAATRGLNLPVVIAERVDPRYYRMRWLWRVARRVAYPLCDALVVQTESIAGWARRVVPNRKIHVIPNAAPTKLVTAEDGAQKRERFVLGVGRLYHQKGFDLLLRSFAASELAQVGWRLVLVGEGPERDNLSQLARTLGISDDVDLPGVTNAPEKWMARCGIFALPSRYEGFPNVLLEAMVAAAPVISFDCPSGPADIIDPGVNGMLIPREDIAGMSRALRDAAQNDSLRIAMGEAARNVLVRFAPERITTLWETLLTSLAARNSHGSAM